MCKKCCDQFIAIWMKTNWNFHQILIVMEKFVREMGSLGLLTVIVYVICKAAWMLKIPNSPAS